MKNKISLFLIIISLIFVFIIFYKGLNKTTLYEPESRIQNIPEFTSVTFFKKEELNSKNIFNESDFYLLNIWASWCLPCRDEHPLLMDLNKKSELKIIGLNYKDVSKNAEKFLNELGNPYEEILVDKNGTIAIEWGAFGVPESFLIHKNKIKKKFIGPLNIKSVEEIKKLLK